MEGFVFLQVGSLNRPLKNGFEKKGSSDTSTWQVWAVCGADVQPIQEMDVMLNGPFPAFDVRSFED